MEVLKCGRSPCSKALHRCFFKKAKVDAQVDLCGSGPNFQPDAFHSGNQEMNTRIKAMMKNLRLR